MIETDKIWTEEVYAYVAAGRKRKAIAVLFRKVDSLAYEGEWARLDLVLSEIDVMRLDTTNLVGLLSITHAMADKLADRAGLVARVGGRLTELAPDRVSRLMDGLGGGEDD